MEQLENQCCFWDNCPKPIIPMPECSKFETEYREELDKDGNKYLKKIGKINVYDKIQEAREGVELSNLIEMYRPKIDEFDLTKMEESIADFTNMPDSLIDVENIILKAKDLWNGSPLEIKNLFNNNFNTFLAGAQNGTLESFVKQKREAFSSENIKVEEVHPTEEEIQHAQEILKGVNLNG